MKIKVSLCQLAQKHHRESTRQYAHVFHRWNTICVAPEFYDLPQTYQAGILLHELGHIELKGKSHTEHEADRAIEDLAGVEILRKNYRGMKNLEYVRLAEKGAALRFLRRCLAI